MLKWCKQAQKRIAKLVANIYEYVAILKISVFVHAWKVTAVLKNV